MTYLEAVNKILVLLREDEVTAVSESKYSKLVGVFVNLALRDVENAWRWVALQDTVQAVTVSGDFRYVLTGLKEGFTLINVFNDTTNRHLQMRTSRWITDRHNITPLSGEPFYFDISGVDSITGDYFLDVYPTPDAAWTINIDLYKEQADIIVDGDEIMVPSYPVMLGGYYRAIAERGEDGGLLQAEAFRDFKTALGDEIAMDNTRRVPGSNDWHSHMRHTSRYRRLENE